MVEELGWREKQRESARLGMQCLDEALVAVGSRCVDENPDFRWLEPLYDAIPSVALDKPGVAPFKFIFWDTVDLRVGPHAEMIDIEVSEATRVVIRDRLVDVLRSTVVCSSGRGADKITMELPGAAPWFTLKTYPADSAMLLESRYAPYADEQQTLP